MDDRVNIFGMLEVTHVVSTFGEEDKIKFGSLFDRMTDDVSKVANELFICDLAGLDG
jgi:hypothetical protein